MFGLFKSAQPSKLTIEGIDGEFEVKPKETILAAALRQGVRFPHSCRVGGCATCKCQLKIGKVKELTSAAYILSKEDLDQSYILGCQSIPKGDVTIRIDSLVDGVGAAPVATAGRIIGKDKLTHDIVKIDVELDNSMTYLAGQYALLSVPGLIDAPRSYSFATPTGNQGGRYLTFFIREVAGGEMSTWMNESAETGQSIVVEGPYGDFYLRNSDKPLILIAGGSGLAPILAILEDALQFKNPRDVTFLFGARTQNDLYCLDQIIRIQDNWAGKFEFIPVLSAEPEESDWQGERGFITESLKRFAGPNKQAYLCGPPPMLDAAEAVLNDAGISINDVFSDKFLDRSYGTSK
ncbi:2Fe-2S iron-sulfur cluster-binding protein [Thalassolituus oleivorans]|jgi:NAD(P)H-flavin reductase/ferredoxin|uniref:Oxidoreductase FAD/NAD(P)-binding subunit n=2 Tax=root TaxID=1 RepID=M5DUJ8_9GAMM|nr:2Fe-2S iron-sulfur cluster binding domain-containing protein [Thalassolituus oleivorans]PCI50665.1 MAG: oxidoreductase [Oceanospirillales bacterium]CCU73057.1 oxidoreductase FAD/NAD(P)-binding subunit [Thalassolituus oleivorans MIL-1]